jgi:hypothetical protein
MKKIFTCLGLALLFGCSKPNEDILVATKYWEAQKNNNLMELKNTLADPKQIARFEHSKLDIESFAVTDSDNSGVLINIKRFCYPDLNFTTSIIDVNGVKKVDSKATFKNLYDVSKLNSKPVRKYCYDFDNSELSGKVNGEVWRIKKVNSRVVDWGNKKSMSISLHPEECDTEYSFNCKRPKLIISNLNLKGDGGNMTPTENITIHTPPSDNLIISKGSYRVTHQTQGEKKVEISFLHDNQNYLNGFFVLKDEAL